MTARERLQKRLDPYWKMEASAVLLVPGVMLLLTEGRIGLLTWLAIIPMVLMLVIGAAYWRGKWRQLSDRKYDIVPLLRTIRKWKPVALILSLIAVGLAALPWIRPEWSLGPGDRVSATIAGLLAIAEYVNYYHRQLQHFDSMADFRRLLAGKGFRRSQMANDLDMLDRR